MYFRSSNLYISMAAPSGLFAFVVEEYGARVLSLDWEPVWTAGQSGLQASVDWQASLDWQPV